MTDPSVEWRKLIHDADQVMWTARAVVQLLEKHEPVEDEGRYPFTDYVCRGCFEKWPCTTYETIRAESCDHG